MKNFNVYNDLLADYNVTGWLKSYLEKQKKGYTGNLDKHFYPFNTNCWAIKDFTQGGFEGWWPYEQYAYWLDGLAKCGKLIGDKTLFEKAVKIIDNAIDNADSDGFVGAKQLREKGKGNAWVHAVFFRVVIYLYRVTGNKKYLQASIGHYKAKVHDNDTWREAVNIENMANLYLLSGDKEMKGLAIECFEKFNQNKDKKNKFTRLKDLNGRKSFHIHVVTFNELAKLGAVMYSITGNQEYLSACVKGFDTVNKKYQLVNGGLSSEEFFSTNDELACMETCNINDYQQSLDYLFKATGDLKYADMLEHLILNCAPSPLFHDFKALQYFSSPNQVISAYNTNYSNHIPHNPRMAYLADHYPECCTGNINRTMPNFALKSFYTTADGLVLMFYNPIKFEMPINKKKVAFEIVTNYPFDENIKIKYNGEKATFALTMRIPNFVTNFELKVNGKTAKIEGDRQVKLNRDWQAGDEISLKFPMKIEIKEWKTGGLYFQRGPLLYTLDIKENKKIVRSKNRLRENEEYQSFDILPKSKWQIAIDRNDLNSIKFVDIKKGEFLTDNQPRIEMYGYFLEDINLINTPLKYPKNKDVLWEINKLKTDQVKIPSDTIVKMPSIGKIYKTKVSAQKVKIALVPYANAILRWTVFPDYSKLRIKKNKNR